MSEKSTGREYFEHVRQDHEELRKLLGTMSGVLADRQEATEKVSEMLASLGERIKRHFHEEENSGFFDQIVEQAPRMVTRTGTVREEHHHLLALVNRIVENTRAKTTSTDEWWQQLRDDFHQFSKALMHHESQEGELIQEAYGEDIGSTD